MPCLHSRDDRVIHTNVAPLILGAGAAEIEGGLALNLSLLKSRSGVRIDSTLPATDDFPYLHIGVG